MDNQAERDESPAKVRRSRRELLAGAAGALGVLAAEAIGRAAPARAADGDPLILGHTNSASSLTQLSMSGADTALTVENVGGGHGALVRSSSGLAIQGSSHDSVGVRGDSATGTGVYGVSVDFSGGSAIGAVVGDSDTNAGVVGLSSAPTRAAGEFNHVKGGRGGVFHGGKAQLKLSPSSASTHPTRGQRGDLFVDKTGRLWFCKGKTTWKQLA
jgi:hypothetical protein